MARYTRCNPFGSEHVTIGAPCRADYFQDPPLMPMRPIPELVKIALQLTVDTILLTADTTHITADSGIYYAHS